VDRPVPLPARNRVSPSTAGDTVYVLNPAVLMTSAGLMTAGPGPAPPGTGSLDGPGGAAAVGRAGRPAARQRKRSTPSRECCRVPPPPLRKSWFSRFFQAGNRTFFQPPPLL